LEDWALAWVQRIRELYQLNDKRVEVIDQPNPDYSRGEGKVASGWLQSVE